MLRAVDSPLLLYCAVVQRIIQKEADQLIAAAAAAECDGIQTDYWKMYAILHGAVMEAMDAMPEGVSCARARLVLEQAMKAVDAVYRQTHEAQEEA